MKFPVTQETGVPSYSFTEYDNLYSKIYIVCEDAVTHFNMSVEKNNRQQKYWSQHYRRLFGQLAYDVNFF